MMSRKRSLLLSAAVAAMVLASGPNPARAGGIPVIDVSSIAQLLTTYSEMLTQSGMMNSQIANQIEQIRQGVQQIGQGADRFTQLATQIDQLQTQIMAMTGTRDLSGVLDGLDGIRDMLPTDTTGADMTLASARFDQLMVEDDVRDGVDLFGDATDPNSLQAVAYVEARDKTYIEAASSQIIIEGMPDIEAAYARLIAEIDNTPDVKASMDLSMWLVAFAALAVGLMTIYSMTKIWGRAFWKPHPGGLVPTLREMAPGERAARLLPIAGLALLTVVIGLVPQPFVALAERAADELLDPTPYLDAVLGGAS